MVAGWTASLKDNPANTLSSAKPGGSEAEVRLEALSPTRSNPSPRNQPIQRQRLQRFRRHGGMIIAGQANAFRGSPVSALLTPVFAPLPIAREPKAVHPPGREAAGGRRTCPPAMLRSVLMAGVYDAIRIHAAPPIAAPPTIAKT